MYRRQLDPAGGGAGVEDDGGAAFAIETGVHLLDPAPVGGGFAGQASPGDEAVEFGGVIVGPGDVFPAEEI